MRRALTRLGVQIRIDALLAGDYLLSEEVCIERKTISDFLNSMYSGRLGYQLERLSKSFRMPFLLVEGRMELYRRPINAKSFYGYLSRLALSREVGLLQTPDINASALLIASMFDKLGREPLRERPRRARRAPDRNGQVALVLESLPGIGPVLAKRLLVNFGSLRSVIEADENSLAKVRGIGKQKARDLRDLVDGASHPSPG